MKFLDLLNNINFFISAPADRQSEYQSLQLHAHVRALTLTKAEVLLFKRGLPKGRIEYNTNTTNIIRSEILNWFLRIPESYRYRFRKNKLHIANANIMSMGNYNKYVKRIYNLKHIDTDEYVLDLSKARIDIDLSFDNCVFHGGIDISHSEMKNLKFSYCTIGIGEARKNFFNDTEIIPSIYANEACIDGSLELTGGQSLYELNNYESYIHGCLYMANIEVSGIFKVSSLIFHETVDISFSKCDVLSFYQVAFLKASLVALYCNIRNVYFHYSQFICDFEAPNYIAADFKALEGEYFFFRNKCLSIGTINLSEATVNKTIDFNDSFLISPLVAGLDAVINDNLTLINAKTSQMLLNNNLISLGKINATQTDASNVLLNNSKFINYSNHDFGRAIDFSNSNISNLWSIVNVNQNDVETSDSTYIKSFFDSLKKGFESKTIDKTETAIAYLKRIIDVMEKILNNSGLQLLEVIEKNEFDNEISSVYLSSKKKKALRNEKYMPKHTLFVGEVNLSSLKMTGKLDLAGGFYYSPSRYNASTGDDSKAKENTVKAINLRHLKLEGDLFINDFKDTNSIPNFRAVGKVDLHSASANQFFVNPTRGMYSDSDWHLTGFKYNYIHCSKVNKKVLCRRKWFKIDFEEPNYRQPYEQLASALIKSGDDSTAKKVIIQGRFRTSRINIVQYVLFAVLGFFSFFGIPAWRSFLVLILLFFIGKSYNSIAFHQDGFTAKEAQYANTFYPGRYTFDNMIPVKFQETEYLTNDNDICFDNGVLSLSLPTTRNFNYCHKIASTIFLTVFIIGIARITKRED